MANSIGGQIWIGIASGLVASTITGAGVYAWKHRERVSAYLRRSEIATRPVDPTPPSLEGFELMRMINLLEEGLARIRTVQNSRSGSMQDHTSTQITGALQNDRGDDMQSRSVVDLTERPATRDPLMSLSSNRYTQDNVREWFHPANGIDRAFISINIQRYLGNDATVRPGLGIDDNEGVQGYWIKAYRNLTTVCNSGSALVSFH